MMIQLGDTTLNALLSPYGLRSGVEYLGGGREDSDGVCYSFRQGGRPMAVKILAWKEPEDDFSWTRARFEERMHALAGRYEHWEHSPRPERNGRPLLGWRNEVKGFTDWCRDPEVKDAWWAMEPRLEALPVERGSFGFIHNDPHGHNILYDGASLKVIDFDVANYHWFMTDVAIALQSALFTWGGLERPVGDAGAVRWFFEGFLRGYEREHHLEDRWLARLGLFVNYRRMLLFTVMQDWLDTNAEVKDSWKRMIAQEPQPLAG